MRTRIDVPVRAHIHMHNLAENRRASPLMVDVLKASLVAAVVEGDELDLHLSGHDWWVSLREGRDGWFEAVIWRVP